jgi:NAD-reducing hydrogenase small subunit
MSLLDIDERIMVLLDAVQLTSSPITDLKHPPEEGVDIGILTGAVSNEDQLAVAKEMRERCDFLIAMGDCATFGGICTMRNYFNPEDVLERAYVETESTVDGVVPRSDEIAKLLDRVKAVHEVVKVDFQLPGCAPDPDTIWFVLTELLEGRTPVLKDKMQYD